MSDDATPRLGLPYLAAAQAQKHVTVNEGLAALDALVACTLESRTVTVQPASPADGQAWLLPTGATGTEWALHPAGTLIRFEAGAWMLLAVAPGQVAYVRDEDAVVVRTASAWTRLADLVTALQNVTGVGIGATADGSNPLIVKGPGALFTADTGGFQVKVNKAAAGQTASLLFQDGYGGRAEIGLTGDDLLHFKVSPDGAGWTDAFTVDGSGRVGFGTASPTSKLQVEGSLRVKTYSKSAMPSPSGEGSGALIYVWDDSAGGTLAFSDGGSWRRVHDRNPVA